MQYLTYAEYLEWRLAQADVPVSVDADSGSIKTGSSESDGGVLSEAAFDGYEFKARKRIDYWTDSRVQGMSQVPEAVKHCMKALIKLEMKYGAEEQVASPLLSSYNTDGYSESYGSASEQSTAANAAAARAVRQWLYGECDDTGTPLLYRGVNG